MKAFHSVNFLIPIFLLVCRLAAEDMVVEPPSRNIIIQDSSIDTSTRKKKYKWSEDKPINELSNWKHVPVETSGGKIRLLCAILLKSKESLQNENSETFYNIRLLRNHCDFAIINTMCAHGTHKMLYKLISLTKANIVLYKCKFSFSSNLDQKVSTLAKPLLFDRLTGRPNGRQD